MQLNCDTSIASAYTSQSQRSRVLSEAWFAENGYCLACEANKLTQSAPNTKATDFSCLVCGHRYELKTFLKRPPKSLPDGAYSSLMNRINSHSAPTLCLLERNISWQIQSLVAIHSCFLTPWAVEQRPPLSQKARRAGWVGCNIRLDRIPPDGEIMLIESGVVFPEADVRKRFQRYLPLASLTMAQRGWAALTLGIVRRLEKRTFFLSDLYAREAEFETVYPHNRHVREKIRQQLQYLRDLGILTFKGSGRYDVID